MPINGITLLKGATGITVTAGSNAVFSDDGLTVQNGIHVVDTSNTNHLTRAHATFKNRPWQPQSDGTFSKGRRDFNITTPKVLASGVVSYPVFRGTMELHPEMTAAEVLELKMLACQCIMDAELNDFYSLGTTR